MLSLLGGIFLGWSLGANDASNVFGTAVSSRMLRFWTAAVLASVFVVAGAVLSGQAGIETLKGLTVFKLEQAVISSVAAALTVTIMTIVGLPVSTSQAVVGAILGIGLLNNQLNIAGLGKVVACWIGTPIGGAVIAVFLYHLMAFIYNRMNLNLIRSDILLRTCLIISGSYGAYALGANNVANVTAVFVGAGLLTVFSAALIGGISIAAGILTYSRPVMETVGKKLVRLDPFSALVVVTAMGITVHIYTLIGVPVSTSQAVVGGVLGVGIVKGANTVKKKTLVNILLAWCLTPVVACFFALMIHFIAHLQYIPG
ncbi:MAG: inorganic phosphate transporter family protein [Desulfobacterales bacterium]|nr:inorganic phosphate transporter family protein [Desulfobacterales bacterium]